MMHQAELRTELMQEGATTARLVTLRGKNRRLRGSLAGRIVRGNEAIERVDLASMAAPGWPVDGVIARGHGATHPDVPTLLRVALALA